MFFDRNRQSLKQARAKSIGTWTAMVDVRYHVLAIDVILPQGFS